MASLNIQCNASGEATFFRSQAQTQTTETKEALGLSPLFFCQLEIKSDLSNKKAVFVKQNLLTLLSYKIAVMVQEKVYYTITGLIITETI